MTRWEPISTAPKDQEILVRDSDNSVYITEWTDDAYTFQGGSGGPSGWFSGKYRDRWGDSPIMDNPTQWKRGALE